MTLHSIRGICFLLLQVPNVTHAAPAHVLACAPPSLVCPPPAAVLLQHYCDEVAQGISQAEDDATMLQDNVARLAAQCTPHPMSAPPAAAAIAPATARAIEEAAASRTPVAVGSALSNVISYQGHSSGNIYKTGNNGHSSLQQAARQ